MKKIVIGNIALVDLERVHRGLRLYSLTEEHRDDVFVNIPVPKGFITNGASVPPMVRKLISPTGAMFRAAVVHDYLYYSHLKTRGEADKIFSAIVYDDTHSRTLSVLAYITLRCCGGVFWRKGPTSIPQVYLE